MKTILTKVDEIYSLMKGDKMIASSDSDFQIDYEVMKLSKQNCDEIFGIFDVGALALEECNNTDQLRLDSVKYKQDPYFRIGYLKGYNKAMELNKDKLFTVEDMKIAYIQGKHGGKTQSYIEFDDFIQSLQQPTEIEVEVHASCIWTQIDVIDPITHTCKSHISKGDKEEPILDENGCLILRKI